MFAELPAATNTSLFYSILLRPSVAERCALLRCRLSTLPVKELHHFFPYLLSNIFGFDHTGGWQLHTFNQKTSSVEFTEIYSFLCPGGEMFQQIARLDADKFYFEFPIGCLPLPTQLALRDGVIPPFYTEKVLMDTVLDNVPTHVTLTAFEYYHFLFAYYLIHCQTTYPGQLWPSFGDAVYTRVSEAYLQYFLPFQGVIPFSSSPQRSPHAGTGHPTTPQFGMQHGTISSIGDRSGLLKVSSDMSTPPRHTSHVTDTSETAETETEIFLQILAEFWLNQNAYDNSSAGILSYAQNMFVPSAEHYLLVRRVLKQIHYFSKGTTLMAASNYLSQSIQLTNQLRNCVLCLIQKKVYMLLKYTFKHAPLDDNFRYALELWLTYIQPWRYTDPLKPSAENKESLVTLSKTWCAFVFEQFPFYTILLIEFLVRALQLDLVSEQGATLVFRVTKVLAQPGLMDFIQRGERALSEASPFNQSAKNSPSAFNSVMSVLIDLEGPTAPYRGLFSPSVKDEVLYPLVAKVQQAKCVVSEHFSGGPAQLYPQPPPTPTTTTPTEKSPWLVGFWRNIVNIFGEDSSSSPGVVPQNFQKVLSLLEATESNMLALFQLDSRLIDDSPPMLGFQSNTTPSSHERHALGVTPTFALAHDYMADTTYGPTLRNEQLFQSGPKCPGVNIEYLGDPLLQPIRSYENPTLVRSLYQLSCVLNTKLAPYLAALNTSKGLVSNLLLQLLAPPPPLQIPVSRHSAREPPRTPTDRVTMAITPSRRKRPDYSTIILI
ncbi:hypothetical protein EMCRGX_G034365 [Ephydatia muelleri]